MSSFSLHDVVRFSVDGAGRLPDYMRMQFATFACLEDSAPDFQLRIGQGNAPTGEPLRLRGDGGDYLRAGTQFVIGQGSDCVVLDGSSPFGDLSVLTADAGFPRMELNRLLELRFRLSMAEEGAVLVHASAVTQGDTCAVFPAWKSTGKTALCLTLLGRGRGFLSDDRVWLRRDGHVLAYPRYLVINASNAPDFPDFLDAGDRFAHAVHRTLESSSLPAIAARIARRVLPPPVRYFPVNQLFPEAPTPTTAKLQGVFFVVRAAAPSDSALSGTDRESGGVWEELSRSQMSELIQAVGDFEWNAELIAMAAAHDVLFPEGPSWRRELDTLISTEGEVLGESLAAADCAQLHLSTSKGRVDWPSAADVVEARTTSG